MTRTDHVLRDIHRLAVMHCRSSWRLRQCHSQHFASKLSRILQNVLRVVFLLPVSPSLFAVCHSPPVLIGLKIQQCVEGKIKMVYLNFPILRGEQMSKRARVYCGKRTCRICVGAYGVGVSCVCLCVDPICHLVTVWVISGWCKISLEGFWLIIIYKTCRLWVQMERVLQHYL